MQNKNLIIAIIGFVIVIALILILKNLTHGPVTNNDISKGGLSMSPQNSATAGGLQSKDIVVGTGAEATNGATVIVNYTGTLTNGTKFDSSYDHGQPFSFTLGQGQVIKGWDLGVLGMKVGGKRQLIIPPDLAYGAQAVGPIPANSTLQFEIELVKVQ